jgi:poly(A) polymerase/tRNA nucleotidyltransferase (CCA-adding enzyme)
MADLGILRAIAPEVSRPDRLPVLRDAGAPADAVLRLAAMLPAGTLTFARRLKLSNEERDRLVRLQSIPAARPTDDDAALRRLLADYRRADLIDRTWLDDGPEAPALRRRLTDMPQPVFPLEGRDVVALGVAPGPRVGHLLRTLRQWWMDGGCVADWAACEAELARRTCAVC